uniref:CST complex subunit CTC1 n=2 Tax=Chrysotila carterae TaxID=13221 RepID=A0A7S4F5T7_CHRCT
MRSTLPELASIWLGLRPSMHERWEGLHSLHPRELEIRITLRLLDLAAPGDSGGFQWLRDGGRDWLSEFFSHKDCCRLGECRARIPYTPPLSAVLSSRHVQKLLARARQRRRPLRLSQSQIAVLWRPKLALLGQICLASPQGGSPFCARLVLRDATSHMRLLLPPAEAARAALLLGAVVYLDAYELIAEPSDEGAELSVHASLMAQSRARAATADAAAAAVENSGLSAAMETATAEAEVAGVATAEMAALEAEDEMLGQAVLYHASPSNVVSASEGKSARPADAGVGSAAGETVLFTAEIVPLGAAFTRGAECASFYASAVFLAPQVGQRLDGARLELRESECERPLHGAERVLMQLYGDARKWTPLIHRGSTYVICGATRCLSADPSHRWTVKVLDRATLRRVELFSGDSRPPGAAAGSAATSTDKGDQRLSLRSDARPPLLSLVELLVSMKPTQTSNSLPQRPDERRVDVRCLLADYEPGESGPRLSLRSASGCVVVDAYVAAPLAALPSGLLPGTALFLLGARAVIASSGSCKLYLKLDMKAAIELDYSQERTSGRTEDADDDAEDSVVHGGGITETNLYAIALKMVKGAGVFRLRLTVTGLTRLWLHLRCTACAGVKQVLGPGGCCCPQYSQLPIASQEAKISSTSSAAAHEDENFVFEIGACAKVTDGTGKAFLDISGSNVWVLMQVISERSL